MSSQTDDDDVIQPGEEELTAPDEVNVPDEGADSDAQGSDYRMDDDIENPDAY